MKGSAGISALKLTVLNKLISKMDKAPNLFFSNMFPTIQNDSDEIKWDIEYGSAGMTPFVAPGAPAPAIGLDGYGEGSAKAAFFKEKMYFDEEFLNNLRAPGTWAKKQKGDRQVARGVGKLNRRIDRRREWMCARMMIDGSFSYVQKGGVKATVNYAIPESHLVTLATDRKWGTGSARQPVEDIFDGKKVISDDSGAQVDYAMCNSEIIKLLMLDTNIQNLLKKSAFGSGDLFANPGPVLASLLGIGKITVYDELYEVSAWLTGNVTADSTTVIPVDDASDFEVGGTLRFIDMSERAVYEDETITAVDVDAGTVTVGTAPSKSFKAGEDRVIMKKKFISDDHFLMFASTLEGEPVAEVIEAPYGNTGRFGKYADKKDEWDPEGTWVRVQDKALPVLYHPDVTYRLKVK